MTNVSKKLLEKSEQEKLFKEFSKLFAQTTSNEVERLFSEMFTPSEQVMFIKRVAIIFMIDEGYTMYRISQTLKVSDSTVRSIRCMQEEGAYESLLKRAKKKTFNRKKFWQTVDVLLRAGMPPRTKDKWKHVPGLG